MFCLYASDTTRSGRSLCMILNIAKHVLSMVVFYSGYADFV